MIKTKLTELLGIEHPIVQGGMQWLGKAELAAAVSNAGGLGIISAATQPGKKELVAEIKKTRDLTDKPFGVNISMLPSVGKGDQTPYYIEAACEEQVAVVETAGRNPAELVPELKKAGIKLIHKVPAARYAKKAEEIGADAVTVVGFECGGHPGMDDVPMMIAVASAVKQVGIPVLAGGGIADGKGLLAVLALGAQGVVLGTRFVASDECIAHPAFKEWIVKARETDTMIVERSIKNPMRVMKNAAGYQVLGMEQAGATLEELLTIISGKVGRKALLEGDLNGGTFAIGQDIGLIDEIKPVAEIIGDLVAGAELAYRNLGRQVTS